MIHGITRPGPGSEKRISGSPKTASSAAMVMSQNMAISQPPPTAWPCTEAITGLAMYQGVSMKSRPSASMACLDRASSP